MYARVGAALLALILGRTSDRVDAIQSSAAQCDRLRVKSRQPSQPGSTQLMPLSSHTQCEQASKQPASQSQSNQPKHGRLRGGLTRNSSRCCTATSTSPACVTSTARSNASHHRRLLVLHSHCHVNHTAVVLPHSPSVSSRRCCATLVDAAAHIKLNVTAPQALRSLVSLTRPARVCFIPVCSSSLIPPLLLSPTGSLASRSRPILCLPLVPYRRPHSQTHLNHTSARRH